MNNNLVSYLIRGNMLITANFISPKINNIELIELNVIAGFSINIATAAQFREGKCQIFATAGAKL